MGRWGGSLPLLGFAVFAASAVVLTVTTVVVDEGPPVWFVALWLAALAWNAYWWLLRTCVEMRVEGSTLEWSAPLRRGQPPVADVIRIRPTQFGRQLAVVELQGRRCLLVPVRVGFSHPERVIAEARRA
jgi:hypothetical protein